MTELYADFDVDTPIDHNFHQLSNDKIRRWESTLPPEYWEYRRKWEENPKNQVVGSFPGQSHQLFSIISIGCCIDPGQNRLFWHHPESAEPHG
ncbi:MAG: hypothetical protein V3U27_08505 [Candidatus Tectomicrobia bacterium]